ncbi:MAG TPA: rubrerythrin family protein [Candidatus Aphodovivens avicola]|nr:rubrerythrin family protein [Candidatus Aphodovivens avicola]
MNLRSELPTAENSTNFNVVSGSTTEVGTTLDNLKAAVTGETGASAKYAAFAEAAEAAGYTQIARLFRATSEAEQVHIAMEYKLVQAEDPEWAKPVADAPVVEACDLNLIAAANGEIYETSDMYPAFIKKAQEEGNDKAVRVFTRAKLAESVHAERYMEAYNNIDAADDDAYFLCPVCGYIEKGDNFEVCPICGAKKSAFKQF